MADDTNPPENLAEDAADEADASTGTATESDSVRAAEFPDLSGAGEAADGQPNLDIVRDINVTLTVELGRTDMVIEEILALTTGKVIELEKLAGEPLDILVNDKLLARGEVVVVDENFGVRITAIVDPRSRVQAMSAHHSPVIDDTSGSH
jgi:flagellar motor switch protein FliN/FliY